MLFAYLRLYIGMFGLFCRSNKLCDVTRIYVQIILFSVKNQKICEKNCKISTKYGIIGKYKILTRTSW